MPPSAEEMYGRYAPENPYSKQQKVLPLAADMTPAEREADPGEYLRRLASETTSAVTTGPQAVGWSPFDRPKSSERSLDDARRSHFYERAMDAYGRPTVEPMGPLGKSPFQEPEGWAKLPPPLREELSKYAQGGDTLRSPWESTGIIGPGSLVGDALTMLSGTSGAAYAASEGLGNAAGDATGAALGAGRGGYVTSPEENWKNFDRAASTFAYPISKAGEYLGIGSDQSVFSERQAMRDNANALAAVDPNRDTRWLYDTAPSREQQDNLEMQLAVKSGEDLLTDYKADELIGRIGAAGVGAVMDAMTNPLVPDLPGIKAAARAGKMGQAWLGLGAEFGLDGGVLGYRAYQDPESFFGSANQTPRR
jgi:hypothetical protein